MRIALCLSGQPRSYEKAHEYINKNLLSKFDVDVFVHTWYYDFFDYNGLMNLYRPKKIKVETKLNLDLERNKRYSQYNVVSSLSSIKSCSDLFCLYEVENKFTYDWVVRSRFDFALNVQLNFLELDSTKIYAPPSVREDIINDQFCIASSSNMKMYSETITNIPHFLSSGCSVAAEDLISFNLRYYKLFDKVNRIDLNPPFPAGDEDCMPNSLIRNDFDFWSDK